MNAASKAHRSMASDLVHHHFTLEQYERMVEDGILTSDDRVELLDGEIVERMPIGSRHSACVRKLERMLFRALADEVASISIQSPVALPPKSEPEPDLAILQPKPGDYANGHPRPDDVLLVIEVADSTQQRDRAKLAIYAAAGIPEAWIVDLNRSVVEVHTAPHEGRYRESRIFTRKERIAPLAFRELELLVDDMLP